MLSIDALRGLAALMVLVYHARSSMWVGIGSTYSEYGLSLNPNAWLGYFSLPFSYGGLGVTLFFVLSGYCIHRRGAKLLAQSRASDLNWNSFAIRRFWRIYPTYFCALLLTVTIDYWIVSTYGVNPGQDNSLLAFGVSLLTLQGFVAPFYGSNGVFWTLAMEIHLYAAYPLLFYLSQRIGPNRVLLITLFVSFGYTVGQITTGFEEYLPHRFQRGPIFLPYWFTWTIGFYLAEVEAERAKGLSNKTWAVLVFVSLPIGLVLTTSNQYLLAEIFCAVAFAGLIQGSLTVRGEQIWRWFGGQLFAAVGVFSYSLYAVHAPLLVAYHSLISPSEPTRKFGTLWPAIGGVALVIPIAYFFFRTVEAWSIWKAATAGLTKADEVVTSSNTNIQ